MPEIMPMSTVEFDAVAIENATTDMLASFAVFLRLEVANGDATDDTLAGYHREVSYYVRWCQQNEIDPARARRSDIIRYRDYLKHTAIAPSTRQLKLSIVRRFYDAAVRFGVLASNPADGIRGGKDLTPAVEKIKALTQGALSTLVDGIPSDTLSGKRDRAVVALMALHGLRRVEVHRLNHEDVEHEPPYALAVMGKGNRARRVFLRGDTYAAVVDYMEAKVRAGLPLDALFVAHDRCNLGGRLSRRGLNIIVDKYLAGSTLKRAGVSCHALRHTHGTLAVAGGAKIEQLRDAMGHSDIATTSLYVRAVDRHRHNPAHFIDVEVKRAAAYEENADEATK